MPRGRGVAIATQAKANEIAETILAAASSQGEEAEVFYVSSSSTPVHFEANQVKAVDYNEASGAAVRLIKGGRIGFGSSSDLANVEGLVGSAVETSAFGAEAKFQFPGAAEYPDVPVFDASVNDVTLEEMVALGQRVVDELRAHSDEVQVEGGVSRSTSMITLMNSRGGRVSYARSGFRIGFEGTVIHGEDMLFTFDGKSDVHPITDPSDIVASIIRQLGWAKQTASVETKSMRVILMPQAVQSILLNPLLAGLNGKTVLHGTSPLVGKLGEKVVDERFSLIDDSTQPWIPASSPSDDEGIPSRRLPLVENGKVGRFLYDLQTAGLAGAQSTGSGERGLGSLPGPSSGVLSVGVGDMTLDEMIADTSEGLIVEALLGAGQGNVLGGDFNANVLLAYKIENGNVVGRVKNTMISGNAYKALNNLMAIGSEGRWVRGGLFAPAIALEDVAVSATG
ncbi:MAG: TldD/PmbA family protein [Chloroflexi bacterium]|nr:TldD/PmbA family protein [Chloroflexota bacterium]